MIFSGKKLKDLERRVKLLESAQHSLDFDLNVSVESRLRALNRLYDRLWEMIEQILRGEADKILRGEK